MMKLAVIFESSPFDRKGLFNAVHNRVKHLIQTGECTIDVYCVHSRDNALTRRLRHTPSVPSVETVTIDGIEYRMMWYRFSILDHVLLEKLHGRPWLFRRFMTAHVEVLKGYDAVMAHSFTGALFAHNAHELYGVPYYVTWHGSDVHTHPWRVPVILEDTKIVMESARCNFFVSKALLAASDKITVQARKEVLYNGVSEDFVEFAPAEKTVARERYGLTPEDRVVAFVGNLVPVKNVMVLPELFAKIASGYSERLGTGPGMETGPGMVTGSGMVTSSGMETGSGMVTGPDLGSLKFWVVGDGKLRSALATAFSDSSSVRIRFFGNVPPADMPAIMNCVDLLVIPSLNEGLPLVCAEALRCGANVVGSDVGGIAEVIGTENVTPLGDGFTDALAAKAVSYLTVRAACMTSDHSVAPQALSHLSARSVPATSDPDSVPGAHRQSLSEDFSWTRTAARELDFLMEL